LVKKMKLIAYQPLMVILVDSYFNMLPSITLGVFSVALLYLCRHYLKLVQSNRDRNSIDRAHNKHVSVIIRGMHRPM